MFRAKYFCLRRIYNMLADYRATAVRMLTNKCVAINWKQKYPEITPQKTAHMYPLPVC